ncbi:alcohol dehydrogenase [Virgibacillus profundi]|uniref:Alcohol dehydrogenase n=1 Tax=Virgibacillus profundi TaxID=2024555 RepID=A0A2A2IB03_9BACI|nr:zinc-binding alcohol dehydrogenase family protein [Virgibacillus profundi]PAV28325.1 alcohol dehydrogenase [Virgibacillus profundi]PXY52313.1 alcohol dehydrogenase [Virgibacillus profundi]
MKAIYVIEPGNIEIKEIKEPQILHSDDVKIKVKAAGICGSDVHIYHGNSAVATYPRVIGHEVVGDIVEVGEGVRNFKINDRVVVDPINNCDHCTNCNKGRPNLCTNLKVRGVHEDGGYREFTVAPERSIYKIPDFISYEEAVMIEPFTVAAQVNSRGQVEKYDSVFIMGSGPAGLSALKVAKNKGARCIVSDLVDERLEKAKQLGANYVINPKKQDVKECIDFYTNNDGANVVIDAVGTANSFEQAMEVVSKGGRIVVLGFTDKASQIPQLLITKDELDISGSRLHNNKFPEVIKWFENGEINGNDYISHIYPYYKIQEALNFIETEPMKVFKVVLMF